MDKNEIRKEVARVLDKLPRQFRKQLHNVEVVVEEWPEEELFLDAGLDPEQDTLYGLYQGIPLPDRSSTYPPILPDKITIFSEPLLRDFPDPDELREQIRTTVLHEIALQRGDRPVPILRVILEFLNRGRDFLGKYG